MNAGPEIEKEKFGVWPDDQKPPKKIYCVLAQLALRADDQAAPSCNGAEPRN